MQGGRRNTSALRDERARQGISAVATASQIQPLDELYQCLLRDSGILVERLDHNFNSYRGLADMLKRPPLPEHVMKNVFFDTCVYHQPGIDLLVKVISIDNILFGSEMVGAVRGIDPETGFNYDDTKRYIDATPNLNDAQRQQVFEGNAKKLFSRYKG